MFRFVAIALLASSRSCFASDAVILVTGATGHTGALLYNQLKKQGVTVRGLVRNVTKARDVLGCSKCDASEGIFVGDVTNQASLEPAVQGVSAMAVVTSATPICDYSTQPPKCHYDKGAYPVDIDFHGLENQVGALAKANPKAQVVMCSSMGTTNPDGFLEKLGNGHIGFFKLNGEAFLMDSGLPYTIVKPCGLSNGPAGEAELLVGHDDEIDVVPPMVSRADVARVMAEALLKPQEAQQLRFDLCSRKGPATTDLSKVLEAAKYPWERAQEHVVV